MDHEVIYESLDSMPADIRSLLTTHLNTRLGRQYADHLQFRQASFMSPQAVPTVVARQNELGREFVSYVILFDMNFGVLAEPYCAGIHLAQDGRIVMDIGLPHMATNPERAVLISYEEAQKVAIDMGLGNEIVEGDLGYDPDSDSLVWELSSHGERTNDDYPTLVTCQIDAHTGQFLGWAHSTILP